MCPESSVGEVGEVGSWNKDVVSALGARAT